MSDEPLEQTVNKTAQQNLLRLCEMMRTMCENMTPAERDRMRQTNLAAARGPVKNLVLLCSMTSSLRALRGYLDTMEYESNGK